MAARYIVGDVRNVIPTLDTYDLVLTSPPFWSLRSYLPGDHDDKALEIGSENTPGEFIDHLLDVVELLATKLAPHGSMVIELGDTFAGSGGAGGDYNPGGWREGQEKFKGSAYRELESTKDTRVIRDDHRTPIRNLHGKKQPGGEGCPLDRSLCLTPEIFRFSLVYGFNPLTGRQTPRWRARNVCRWVRPNPPVGFLGDKFRPGTSELVVICKDRRYFDLEAVRQPYVERRLSRGNSMGNGRTSFDAENNAIRRSNRDTGEDYMNGPGAPPLDWWLIPTQPYSGAHYAVWPEKLCEIPIASMCPQKVCTVCGKPSTRIVEYEHEQGRVLRVGEAAANKTPGGDLGNPDKPRWMTTIPHTLGWTDCGHDAWRNGIVLDPFAGSGTTLQVATGHGRDAIGIDLDERNAELAMERVGPLLLEVEHLTSAKSDL